MVHEKYLVVGGAGFLGSAIVKLLLGDQKQVVIFDVRRPASLDANTRAIVGDITSYTDILAALDGVSCVIHTASPPHGRGPIAYHAVNVVGTQNIVKACKDAGVKKLIFTSSASVVFNGVDIFAGDESIPHCDVHMDAYNESKATAETIVREANDSKLATVCLRPSGIFGPGYDLLSADLRARDAQATWEMYSSAKRGMHKVILGNNTTLFDFTYVDNIAHAHLLAAQKVEIGNEVSGQVFIITNDEPVFMWDFMKALFEGLDFRPSFVVTIPFSVAFTLAYIAEAACYLLKPFMAVKLTFTIFRMTFLSTNRYFDISKAKQLLGYRPIVSLENGIKLTVDWLKTFEKV